MVPSFVNQIYGRRFESPRERTTLTSLTASKRSLSLVCSPAHAHIVRIVISTGLPVTFLTFCFWRGILSFFGLYLAIVGLWPGSEKVFGVCSYTWITFILLVFFCLFEILLLGGHLTLFWLFGLSLGLGWGWKSFLEFTHIRG